MWGFGRVILGFYGAFLKKSYGNYQYRAYNKRHNSKHISANLRKRISILYVQTSSQYLLISVCLTKVKRLINLKRTDLFLMSCPEPI